MIGKALLSGGIMLSIVLSGCSDLNSEPIVYFGARHRSRDTCVATYYRRSVPVY
jgi:hypothetical protein